MRHPERDQVLKEFGRRLKAARKARGLLQSDMTQFGISHKYYQRVESGRQNPTLLTIMELASVLDIQAGTLLRGMKCQRSAD